MLSSLLTVGLCASSVVAHNLIQINYPLGQWDTDEDEQHDGEFCGGADPENARPWLGDDTFISLTGDAGDSVTVLFTTSSFTSNNTDDFDGFINSPNDFNITLIENATLPESGNLCIDTVLPSLTEGSIGFLYVATNTNLSACATVQYLPESADGLQVPGSNLTYREYYCSNSTTLPVVDEVCDCHCHGAEEHCEGNCSTAQIDHAHDECEADHDDDDHDHDHDDDEGECDCHCHGDEEHCSGECTQAQLTDARAECSAAAGGSTTTTGSGSTTASGTGGAATATGNGAIGAITVGQTSKAAGIMALIYAFILV